MVINLIISYIFYSSFLTTLLFSFGHPGHLGHLKSNKYKINIDIYKGTNNDVLDVHVQNIVNLNILAIQK